MKLSNAWLPDLLKEAGIPRSSEWAERGVMSSSRRTAARCHDHAPTSRHHPSLFPPFGGIVRLPMVE